MFLQYYSVRFLCDIIGIISSDALALNIHKFSNIIYIYTSTRIIWSFPAHTVIPDVLQRR